MTEIKVFPLHAALSISTGVLMGDFGKVHELAEWVAGFPIWTHQLPRLGDALAAEVRRQHPTLPDKVGGVTSANVADRLSALEAVHGIALSFSKGGGNSLERRGPISELIEKVGADRVFVLAGPPSPSEPANG